MSTGALYRFYRSKRWERARRLYLEERHYVCERCGHEASVVHHRQYLKQEDVGNLEKTVGFDNLEALCSRCHAIEHHGGRATREGITFDADGNVVIATIGA